MQVIIQIKNKPTQLLKDARIKTGDTRLAEINESGFAGVYAEINDEIKYLTVEPKNFYLVISKAEYRQHLTALTDELKGVKKNIQKEEDQNLILLLKDKKAEIDLKIKEFKAKYIKETAEVSLKHKKEIASFKKIEKLKENAQKTEALIDKLFFSKYNKDDIDFIAMCQDYFTEQLINTLNRRL